MKLDHGMNCPALGAVGDDGCTCGLRYRIELQTEREMHAAWRKRAEEAEAERDRITRNRDMWKGQCERQAEQLSKFNADPSHPSHDRKATS